MPIYEVVKKIFDHAIQTGGLPITSDIVFSGISAAELGNETFDSVLPVIIAVAMSSCNLRNTDQGWDVIERGRRTSASRPGRTFGDGKVKKHRGAE